eukprot:10599329-Karenia_brevis.AAC.1
MDANIDQRFVCNLNGLLVGYKANMASKRPPSWGGGNVLVPVFGLVGSRRLLEVSWGSRRFKTRF